MRICYTKKSVFTRLKETETIDVNHHAPAGAYQPSHESVAAHLASLN
ncbi:MAG TPA: hypothetical protein IAA05_00155 [Candidatus Blautia excrementipullorum]|nr:hypothetical protein [Candidatus Blautia excrementipullorum]